MASQTVLPLNTYAAGSYELGPATIPDGITRADLSFDLTHLLALTLVLTIRIQVSLDGGVTWPIDSTIGLNLPLSGYTLNGGVITTANGKTITSWTSGFSDLPLVSNRRVKATFTLSENFQTSGTLTLT